MLFRRFELVTSLVYAIRLNGAGYLDLHAHVHSGEGIVAAAYISFHLGSSKHSCIPV